jgi:hypothetical protein
MNCLLKDKLVITKEFLQELEDKSWQEIEYLQSQIANIEATNENSKLIALLKSLLTSYYVFTGGLENLDNDEISQGKPINTKYSDEKALEDDYTAELILDTAISSEPEAVLDSSEPFEYFVDFDEPIGEPLTDDDLYNN